MPESTRTSCTSASGRALNRAVNLGRKMNEIYLSQDGYYHRDSNRHGTALHSPREMSEKESEKSLLCDSIIGLPAAIKHRVDLLGFPVAQNRRRRSTNNTVDSFHLLFKAQATLANIEPPLILCSI